MKDVVISPKVPVSVGPVQQDPAKVPMGVASVCVLCGTTHVRVVGVKSQKEIGRYPKRVSSSHVSLHFAPEQKSSRSKDITPAPGPTKAPKRTWYVARCVCVDSFECLPHARSFGLFHGCLLLESLGSTYS